MKLSKTKEKKFRKEDWDSSWAAKLDVVGLLEQQNAYKQRLLNDLDKSIQTINQRKRAKK